MDARRGRWQVLVALGTAALVALAACSSAGSSNATTPGSTAPPTLDTTTAVSVTQFVPLTEALPCDPFDERACLLPWPNDAFTVPDASTATGRRLDIQADSTPTNASGVHVDVTDQNRADGFSPGSAILTLVPALDPAASGIAPSTDIAASLRPDAPVVLLDTTSGTRLAHWGELDAHATKGDQLLMVHPAASLPEGHHIIVALRRLKNASGAVIPRTEAFQAAIDGTTEPPERVQPMRDLLATLSQHDVPTDDLYLAWDFTVASGASLSGRMLHIRSQAYTAAGSAAPAFTVTSSTDDGSVRTVEGVYQVPNYLTGDGAPGNRFMLGADGMPTLNADHATFAAPFRCLLPLKAVGAHPTIVFGHGLLGTRSQVDGLSFAASMGLAAACATDEIGMSTDDVGNLATILADLSHFPEQADRMQQGNLNMQFLGRALNLADGFASAPAFQSANGAPLIDVGNTTFVGNSQGGVLGAAYSAVSTEWTRVVLGVPGIDYSLLLPRSSDWPEFQTIFDAAYTDPVDRVLGLQLIQLLWDRGENDGYAQHLTSNPYPGMHPKSVLMIQAFGDHQVANVSTEVLARTIGARVHRPALASGRSRDVTPQWGIDTLDHAAPGSAALVVWDYGTPAPPTVNLPPTEPEYGKDPHGAGSQEPLVLQQALTFLISGKIDDVCKGGPCKGTPAG